MGRTTQLLEIQEVSQARKQVGVAIAGFLTAGPLGLLASSATYRTLKGNLLPWALIGVVAAPPLAYAQWIAVQMLRSGGGDAQGLLPAAVTSITEADKAARSCALAIKNKQKDTANISNPLDGQNLFCDESYPSTVVITSRRFDPIAQVRSCGLTTLLPGTSATQWMVSPAGTLACKAVGRSWVWWGGDNAINRAELYRRCTENLRQEARTDFTRSAHQLGLRDYCAEERALLARDRIRNPL
jgi:hypothetical protein